MGEAADAPPDRLELRRFECLSDLVCELGGLIGQFGVIAEYGGNDIAQGGEQELAQALYQFLAVACCGRGHCLAARRIGCGRCCYRFRVGRACALAGVGVSFGRNLVPATQQTLQAAV